MSFESLAAGLEKRAALVARRHAARRRAARQRDGTHWRSAPYLWPLFGA